MSVDEVATLVARTQSYAKDGKFEFFKTSNHFDGTAKHPDWMGEDSPAGAASGPPHRLTCGVTSRGSMSVEWRIFAVGSAGFAALTAIFGKVGVTGLNSNFATFLRTVVILAVVALIVEWRSVMAAPRRHIAAQRRLPGAVGYRHGLSWLCYYRALQLAPGIGGGTHRQTERRIGGVDGRRLSGRTR